MSVLLNCDECNKQVEDAYTQDNGNRLCIRCLELKLKDKFSNKLDSKKK